MSDNAPKTQWSKSIFVFVVIAFCLGVASKMGFDQTLTTKVSEIVADGLISLALFVAVSFLATTTVDYSGVLNKVGRRLGGVVVTPPDQINQQQNYVPTDPAYISETDSGAKG